MEDNTVTITQYQVQGMQDGSPKLRQYNKSAVFSAAPLFRISVIDLTDPEQALFLGWICLTQEGAIKVLTTQISTKNAEEVVLGLYNHLMEKLFKRADWVQTDFNQLVS